jgi:hypothetical protein
MHWFAADTKALPGAAAESPPKHAYSRMHHLLPPNVKILLLYSYRMSPSLRLD